MDDAIVFNRAAPLVRTWVAVPGNATYDQPCAVGKVPREPSYKVWAAAGLAPTSPPNSASQTPTIRPLEFVIMGSTLAKPPTGCHSCEGLGEQRAPRSLNVAALTGRFIQEHRRRASHV